MNTWKYMYILITSCVCCCERDCIHAFNEIQHLKDGFLNKKGSVWIKQLHKFSDLGIVTTDDGKYDTEIRMLIVIEKEAFEKLNQDMKEQENTVRNQWKWLCCATSIKLYNSK